MNQKKQENAVDGNETILIVDDEKTLLDIGRDLLKLNKYIPLTAESGERAVEIYKEKKTEINLIILDWNMPGIGGHRCLIELLKIEPELKVIVSSGYASSNKVREILKAGAIAFIPKPYQFQNMLKKIRELLDKK